VTKTLIFIIAWLVYAWIAKRVDKWVWESGLMKPRTKYKNYGFEVIYPAPSAGQRERENDHG
jgi:hypothetical protein